MRTENIAHYYAVELLKAYEFGNVKPPRAEIVQSIAMELATELPVSPDIMPRLFTIARSNTAHLPKLYDLKKAYAILKEEQEEQALRNRPRLSAPPPITQEEREAGVREMMEAARKLGLGV